jgi:hypothetical protein
MLGRIAIEPESIVAVKMRLGMIHRKMLMVGARFDAGARSPAVAIGEASGFARTGGPDERYSENRM